MTLTTILSLDLKSDLRCSWILNCMGDHHIFLIFFILGPNSEARRKRNRIKLLSCILVHYKKSEIWHPISREPLGNHRDDILRALPMSINFWRSGFPRLLVLCELTCSFPLLPTPIRDLVDVFLCMLQQHGSRRSLTSWCFWNGEWIVCSFKHRTEIIGRSSLYSDCHSYCKIEQQINTLLWWGF